MEAVAAKVEVSSTLDDAERILTESADVSWFLVVDGDDVVGVLTRADALAAVGQRGRGAALGEIARRDWLRVEPRSRLADIVSGIRARAASCALVVREPGPVTADAVCGLITKAEIADALAQMSELYAG